MENNNVKNRMVAIAKPNAKLPAYYDSYVTANIDAMQKEGIGTTFNELVPPFVLIDSRVKSINYVDSYYKDCLMKLDPIEEYKKLDGVVLLSEGIHGLVIAAWFDLFLGELVPYYSVGTTERKDLNYQDETLYKTIRNQLERTILDKDYRMRNNVSSYVPHTRYSSFRGFIHVEKDNNPSAKSTKTVRGGYLRYLSRKTSYEYIKGGKKDPELKKQASDYMCQALTFEQNMHNVRDVGSGRGKK